MAQQYFKVTFQIEVLLPARNPGDAESQIADSSLAFTADQIDRGTWAGAVARGPDAIEVEHVPRQNVLTVARRLSGDSAAAALGKTDSRLTTEADHG
jgi:hypothetical protein